MKTTNPNRTKTQSNHKTQNNLSIAIVGASYAGLTLANVLQKQWNDNHSNNRGDKKTNANNNNTQQMQEEIPQLKISIFEKMGPPGSVGHVSGNLRLPSYETILHEIGINQSGPSHSTSIETTNSNKNGIKNISHNDPSHSVIHESYLVPQHAFTEMLRSNVQTKIQYRKQLVQILSNKEAKAIYEKEQKNNHNNKLYFDECPSENDDDSYYLEMKCSDNNLAKKVKDKDRFVIVTIPQYNTIYKGPFHIIIGADGVLSTCRKQLLSFRNHHDSTSLPILLIGDARWVQYRWWDFGRLRIRSGADISTCDGVELGKRLTQKLDRMIQFRNDKNKNLIHPSVSLNYYPNRLLACTEDQVILNKFHLNDRKWSIMTWERKHLFVMLLVLIASYAIR